MGKSRNFSDWQFLEFSKSQIFSNFLNCKFCEFFKSQEPKFGWKIGNFGTVRPFDIPHYSQFRQFSYFSFDINQFSQFLFPTLVTRKFGRSTFVRPLVFKFETSAILKFYCLKNFEPSPQCTTDYSVKKSSFFMNKDEFKIAAFRWTRHDIQIENI